VADELLLPEHRDVVEVRADDADRRARDPVAGTA